MGLLFENVTPSDLLHIANGAQQLSYSAGQTIFLQDDPVRYVLVVATGRVKVTQLSELGKETLLRVEVRGCLVDDVTGESQLHSLNARAMEPTQLLAWDTAIFEAFASRIPVLQRNMITIMRARLKSLQERFCDVSTLRVPQRIARILLQLTDERPGSSTSVALSREELGQMAGTSLFTVSRLLSDWADSNVVTLDRKEVVIEDRERLQQLADCA